MILWLKSFHVIFMVTWMAAIFYLPLLFVYHCQAIKEGDERGSERFKIMERKLFFGIMTPGMVLTTVFGTWMLVVYGWDYFHLGAWLHAKLALVTLLLIYHGHCFVLMRAFKNDANKHTERFFRFYNEMPVFMLIGIVILVLVKPF